MQTSQEEVQTVDESDRFSTIVCVIQITAPTSTADNLMEEVVGKTRQFMERAAHRVNSTIRKNVDERIRVEVTD